MEATDPPNSDDVPTLQSSTQHESSSTKNQRVVSNIEPRVSSRLPTAVKSHHNLTLPPKPTHLPPPVPSPGIKSALLDASSASSQSPPTKPPRTTFIPVVSEEETPPNTFNAYDCEGQHQQQQRRAAQLQQQPRQSNIQLRDTRGWQAETDEKGWTSYTSPNSTNQKSSRQSAWNFPMVELQNATPSTAFSQRPASTITELPSAPISCFSSNNINTIDLTEAQAKFGAGTMSSSKSGDSLSTMTSPYDGSSRFYRVTKDYISGPIENKIRTTERRGQVNFTKVMVNGVRVPKKWIPSFLVLIGPTLCVYKDSKLQSTAASPDASKSSGVVSPKTSIKMYDSGMKFFNFLSKSSTASGKPELELHVKDLQICPADKSYTSRDHAFVLKDISNPDGVAEYLIEVPSAELRRAWETAVQYSKDFDKEDRFDGRAFATHPPPSVDQKVISMLREFFRKRPTLESIRESGILQNEPVFGSNLIELCQKERTKVPTFVTRVIRAVEARGLETTGLYRKSGNGAAIQKLRNQVNHSEYSLNSDEWDIYELSDSLKLFLRELKEPLFRGLYDELKEFNLTIASCTDDQNVINMRIILSKLHECHYATAKLIFDHLSKVAALESVNQMSATNLALVFGPNVIWGDTSAEDYIRFPFVGCACTEFIITNNAAVFASICGS